MEEYLKQILARAVEQDVSDVFVVAGFPLAFKTAAPSRPRMRNVWDPRTARLSSSPSTAWRAAGIWRTI